MYGLVIIDIIVWWFKIVLCNSGVNIDVYLLYSIRVVFILVVVVNGCIVDEIMICVGWVNVWYL